MSGVAGKKPCSAFAGCTLEALVDFLFGKLEDFLDANGHLGRRGRLAPRSPARPSEFAPSHSTTT